MGGFAMDRPGVLCHESAFDSESHWPAAMTAWNWAVWRTDTDVRQDAGGGGPGVFHLVNRIAVPLRSVFDVIPSSEPGGGDHRAGGFDPARDPVASSDTVVFVGADAYPHNGPNGGKG